AGHSGKRAQRAGVPPGGPHGPGARDRPDAKTGRRRQGTACGGWAAMIVRKAELVATCALWKQLPEDDLPEIALAGRSNVGKSSLINRMLNRWQLARTSAVPGKTQTLNFYRINDELYFVDFPGYGYAKASRGERQKWGKLIERYLLERRQLRLLLLLIDIRHPPTALDRMMYEWAAHHRLPLCLVAT